VTWTWDMRKTGGLPPGTAVWYYWEVKDASGASARTEPATLRLSDDRFRWQSLTQGEITLYWHSGDSTFGRTLVDAATAGLQKLRNDTGAGLGRPVNIWVYAGSKELQGALIFPQEWTGAVAYSPYSTIMAGIAPGSLSWGRHALPHELSHLIIHEVTFNCYGDVPTWLDEGLAEYASAGSSRDATLTSAISKDQMFSVRSLSSAFPAESDAAMLSYAESQSIVDFLINQYGSDKMSALLTGFRAGRTYDDALRLVYGLDQDGLDAAWRQSVGLKPRAEVSPTPSPTPIPTLVPVGGSPIAQAPGSGYASWPLWTGLGGAGFAGSVGLLRWKRGGSR